MTDFSEIEKLFNVNIDVTDEDGMTQVYTYTDDGDRLGFEFNSMNPEVVMVAAAASAINNLRLLANIRPRIGKPRPE